MLIGCVFGFGVVFAGDDASGTTRYSIDLGARFESYQLTPKDRDWASALARKFKYTGPIVYFVRTSLPLTIGAAEVKGQVYVAVDQAGFFYVIPGDTMIGLGGKWPYDPGVGGFSMHASGSRNFIACMNFQRGGVPVLNSSPVTKGVVS